MWLILPQFTLLSLFKANGSYPLYSSLATVNLNGLPVTCDSYQTFWLLDRTGNTSTVKTAEEIQEHEKAHRARNSKVLRLARAMTLGPVAS